MTPLECGIIFDGIPEGAISRKVGLIWGIPDDMSSGDITAVTTAGGVKITNSQDMGDGFTLADYVDKASTVYCYVYGDDGIIDQQWDTNSS